ncbi:MAG: protein kinase [Chloroflexota bacterium]
MTDELLGKKIGGYEITDVIGRGGMATVYRAYQVSMNRVVALKVLPRHLANDDTYLQRFHREVKIASQLEHRNIVPVHDYGEYEGQPYIVMRYLPGGSVDDLLKNGPLALEQIIELLDQIAPALDYAHGKGVLHRDLKPSNVLIDDNGGAYLTDFGIARILGETSSVVTTQGVVGTPSYMSPEQAQGQPLDPRSDLYALGVMLFEMATGRRPFESDTPYSIAVMQVTTTPPSPRSINPAISRPVEQVILKALKKRRDERFSSAAEMLEALKEAASVGNVDLADTQPGFAIGPTEPVVPPAGRFPEPPRMPTPPQAPPSTGSGSMPRLPRVRRRRRPNNMLVGTFIGGLVGCGLLALLIALILLLIQQTSERELAATASAEAAESARRSGADAAAIRTTPVPSDNETGAAGGTGVTGALLYFAERDGNFDIYRLDLATGEEQRLTTHPAADVYPMMSPDGGQIAFQSDRDNSFDLFVMDAGGANQRRVLRTSLLERMPAWSPDGELLAFSMDARGDGNHDLYTIRPGGGELQLLLSNGRRNSHPRWSPDGRYIVFTTGMAGDARTWEIARLDVAAGDVVYLTDNDVKDWSPSFHPGGREILYLTEGEGHGAIGVMDFDGDNQRIIYDGPGYESSASYSPDGRYIAFSSDESGRDEIYIMTANGENVQQVTKNGGHYPTWIAP